MGFLFGIGAILLLIGIIAVFAGLITLLAGWISGDKHTRKTGAKILLLGSVSLLFSFTLCSFTGGL